MEISTHDKIYERIIPAPVHLGSYSQSDVVFLLKDLSEANLEKGTEAREEAIQLGVHYSEMLPIEYQPTPEYIQLFHDTLAESAEKIALAAGVVAELIIKKHKNAALISLARAGTPIGILIKRYISYKYKLDLPHYSISIIRGKGIDENALKYIFQQHGLETQLQFIDGWTGKGAIRKVLIESCREFERKYGIRLNDDLAVLADPGYCSGMYGTREDYLIPSACLNSTVSGLMSRTILRNDLIGSNDFHGAKYYKEWLNKDLSNCFIDAISVNFPKVAAMAEEKANEMFVNKHEVTWKGLENIRLIQQQFEVEDVNLIKPGVGETTRVLLRRVPWKILVDRLDNPNLKHIMLLAKDRDVSVEVFPGLSYSCCGLIKSLKAGEEG
jgi:hypothetical protein